MFIVRGILDSLSGIPNSKAQDSEFQKKIFPRDWIPQEQTTGIPEPDFLTWSEPMVILECCVLDEGVSHNLFCFGRLLLSGNENNGNLSAGC